MTTEIDPLGEDKLQIAEYEKLIAALRLDKAEAMALVRATKEQAQIVAKENDELRAMLDGVREENARLKDVDSERLITSARALKERDAVQTKLGKAVAALCQAKRDYIDLYEGDPQTGVCARIDAAIADAESTAAAEAHARKVKP